MAVFRIEKTRDYTVMSNHHLRNAGLSLKSKGLLSRSRSFSIRDSSILLIKVSLKLSRVRDIINKHLQASKKPEDTYGSSV